MKLIDYIKSNRRGRQANQVEREAMVDPFLSDAIEGFDAVYANHTEKLGELQEMVSKRASRKRRSTKERYAADESPSLFPSSPAAKTANPITPKGPATKISDLPAPEVPAAAMSFTIEPADSSAEPVAAEVADEGVMVVETVSESAMESVNDLGAAELSTPNDPRAEEKSVDEVGASEEMMHPIAPQTPTTAELPPVISAVSESRAAKVTEGPVAAKEDFDLKESNLTVGKSSSPEASKPSLKGGRKRGVENTKPQGRGMLYAVAAMFAVAALGGIWYFVSTPPSPGLPMLTMESGNEQDTSESVGPLLGGADIIWQESADDTALSAPAQPAHETVKQANPVEATASPTPSMSEEPAARKASEAHLEEDNLSSDRIVALAMDLAVEEEAATETLKPQVSTATPIPASSPSQPADVVAMTRVVVHEPDLRQEAVEAISGLSEERMVTTRSAATHVKNDTIAPLTLLADSGAVTAGAADNDIVVNEAFMEYFASNSAPLTDADGNKVLGAVVLEFRVNDKGVPSSIRVISSPMQGMGRQVIDLLVSGPRWEPTGTERIRTRVEYK